MDLPKNAAEVVEKVKGGMESKAPELDVLAALQQAMKVPGAKIDREKFLRKELKRRYSKVIIDRAVEHNPAYAWIPREEIDKLAKHAIDYECNKATAISFTTGLPGGAVGVAAIPADIIQYFVFMLRVIQELAYLYGFDDFHLDENDVDNEAMNTIMIFLGVMFGVQQANVAIKVVANMAGRNVAKRLAQKALTKGTVYPIVKKIATAIGYKMTKEIFAGGVGRMVPVLGGIITGGLTYATFKPCANTLKNTLRKEPISDPQFYKSGEYMKRDETIIPDAEDVVFYSIDPDEDEAAGENVNDSQSTPLITI